MFQLRGACDLGPRIGPRANWEPGEIIPPLLGSPFNSESDVPRPPTTPATCMPEEGETQTVPTSPEPSQPGSPLHPGAPPTSEAEVQLELKETPQAEPHARYGADLKVEDGILALVLPPGPGLPSRPSAPLCPHSPRSQPLPPLTLAQDEDTAQIGPKRIR